MSVARRNGWDDGEIGPGFLSRAAALIYRYLVLEVVVVLATLPTAVVLVLLAPDPSNLPLYALALVPVGPALVAALSAVHRWEREPSLSPARTYWSAYRSEAVTTLAWWVPWLALMTVIAINLTYLDRVPAGAAMRPALWMFGAVAVAWAGAMAVLTARFEFRLRDAVRIALASIFARPQFSLGVLVLVAAAGAIVAATSDAVGLLLAWAGVVLVHLMSVPLVSYVTERFTRDE